MNERTIVDIFAPLPAPAVGTGIVVAVSSNPSHGFSKINRASIRLVAGLGVAGDAHFGQTVQHLVRIRDNPGSPNLRQVHLIPSELFAELDAAGFAITPGAVGENVTTKGINLLKLPKGTRLHLGDTAAVELTGLRTPCRQLDRFQPGLLAQMTGRDEEGNLLIKSGVMGIVLKGGTVRPDDTIRVALPPEPHEPLGKI